MLDVLGSYGSVIVRVNVRLCLIVRLLYMVLYILWLEVRNWWMGLVFVLIVGAYVM